MFKKSAPMSDRPPHIYTDDTLYFVTAATLNRAHLLSPSSHKPHLQEQLLTLAPDYNIDLKAWVILNNHYHILFHLTDANKLRRFFQRLHAKTATNFNLWEQQSGRQVWWNYWDRCIRNERDYWTRFNYIHYNPIKHNYVQRLRDWPFSSLFLYLEEQGREWIDDCWRSYPIKEFELDDDDF